MTQYWNVSNSPPPWRGGKGRGKGKHFSDVHLGTNRVRQGSAFAVASLVILPLLVGGSFRDRGGMRGARTLQTAHSRSSGSDSSQVTSLRVAPFLVVNIKFGDFRCEKTTP